MASGCSDAMKEERAAPAGEDAAGGGSPGGPDRSAANAAAQNGGGAPEQESGRSDLPLRRSSSGESHVGGWGHRPPEEAPRKRFQIPRKSREKKALQLISSDSREFEEILKILHSSFLDTNSKTNFTYNSVRLIHNEFLEKEFTEKRRQLKCEGRLDKELVESYAFLLVGQEQMYGICEKGLLTGHSTLTTLGKSSLGVYLSKFADLLQTNPLEPGATGDILIFKVIKGKMKCIHDFNRNNQTELCVLDPAPNHECHILKNPNAVTSLLSYRAFERTQYYFYEYRFSEILRRPSHVCPYAVVSFIYKEDLIYRQPSLSGSINFSNDRYNDRSSFTLWRGQLCSKGIPLCFASLKTNYGPFFPYRLPEKLDLEILMKIDQIKKRIPSKLFYRETHNKTKEVVTGGMYARLYEVVEITRTGSNFQGLMQKLSGENLALVKPLADKGFLFFFFPVPMTSSYSPWSGKSRVLHALFIYKESRETPVSTPSTFITDNEIMPDLKTFLSALHYALLKCQDDTSSDLCVLVEKYARLYLKRRAERAYKFKEYILKPYDSRLDNFKSLYVAPKKKSHIDPALRIYIREPEMYAMVVGKAKEILQENLLVDRPKEVIRESFRFQQFSPVSDYEPVEEDHEIPKYSSRKTTKLESSAGDSDLRAIDHSEYELEKIHGLINLIQSRKQNANSQPGAEIAGDASVSGVKRKLESGLENQWKHFKSENLNHNREESVEAAHSMSSFITALGGQDTDLRQENSEAPVTESSECLQMILASLNNSGFFNSPLVESLNKILATQSPKTNENNVLNHEIISPSQDEVMENSRPDWNSYYEDEVHQRVELPESDTSILAQSTDDRLKAKVDLEQCSESVSPCPSTPTENVYQRQSSNLGSVESEMHWKLIPITGEEGRIPEDHVGNIRDETIQGLSLTEEQLMYASAEDTYPEDPRALHIRRSHLFYSSLQESRKRRSRASKSTRRGSGSHSSSVPNRAHDLFQTKHYPNGLIENTVLEMYSIFSERLHEVLKQNDIAYANNATIPLLSSDERTAKLSDWLSEQASDICVKEYVEELREKLNSVVALFINSPSLDQPTGHLVAEIKEAALISAHRSSADIPLQNEIYDHPVPDHLPSVSKGFEDNHPSRDLQQDLSEVKQTKDNFPLHTNEEPPTKPHETPTSNLPDSAPTAHTDLANLINQMHPEVFHNLVKIFTHVNKNIVKFYIHAEEENTICAEIKEYLLKLGNAQCDPENFLSCNAVSDKLLIIIQNEDIERCIHKIPHLRRLKTLSCVSFAGVDTLDDLKNHTYNELFVSGGFLVSDETVLNPESMTTDALQKFLMFLEEISSSEGKWQWKIHCKFQKKLKEMGRLNANASNILTLLNNYQKKHLVEILAYHNCDSQTRQAPELECLIRLQVQNIQQRHVVFLTEKDASQFTKYLDNGIVVTRIGDFMHNFANLVGFHSANSEENGLSQLATQETQPAPGETDVKDEEDMSLDSEDGMPQIELCTDSLKSDSHNEEPIKQSEHADPSLTAASVANLQQNITLNIDSDDVQTVTPISTAGTVAGENNTATAGGILNNFPDYTSSQIGLSHQISHFNVLTHQTFLGTMYPILSNQAQSGNYYMNSYSQVAERGASQNSEWDQKWNMK
ncbi:protein TASOR isoform X1 [Pelobates fuscus]|uniref:protein TASOR isoform X1 n=1 Tax=Pelobates fuscus TaxID=191477 RepID=UPI002FE468D3